MSYKKWRLFTSEVYGCVLSETDYWEIVRDNNLLVVKYHKRESATENAEFTSVWNGAFKKQEDAKRFGFWCRSEIRQAIEGDDLPWEAVEDGS